MNAPFVSLKRSTRFRLWLLTSNSACSGQMTAIRSHGQRRFECMLQDVEFAERGKLNAGQGNARRRVQSQLLGEGRVHVRGRNLAPAFTEYANVELGGAVADRWRRDVAGGLSDGAGGARDPSEPWLDRRDRYGFMRRRIDALPETSDWPMAHPR